MMTCNNGLDTYELMWINCMGLMITAVWHFLLEIRTCKTSQNEIKNNFFASLAFNFALVLFPMKKFWHRTLLPLLLEQIELVSYTYFRAEEMDTLMPENTYLLTISSLDDSTRQ